MATISVEDAVRLAESTVRLWSVEDNVHQGTFFRMTPQNFNVWKTTHQIARILTEDIPQDAQGLLKFTTIWQDKMPQMNRCTIRIQEAVEDPRGTRNYPQGIRKKWYQHIKGRDPPVLGSDQEWQSVLDVVIKGWKLAADYMIEKNDAGHQMINVERTFQEASIEAVTLPGDMYTEVVTYEGAMATARELSAQGNRWTVAANGYYQMTPTTQDARRGMTELIGDMEVIRDWDYDNVKLAIEGDTNRAITVYKPGSNITIRTFPHIG